MATNSEDFSGIEAETSFEVNLYIYDLSKELSKSFKKILKGKPLPGIWHTGLVAYGREYYFTCSGVESCRPGETILGEPDQILTLGKTELPYSVFLEYVFALGESTYKPVTYNLLEHNCNTFSQEVSNFLTGGPIPQELRELPPEILNNKTLSNSLREYFDKLSFRVEGSKGISFGNSSNQNGHSSRKSSVDQIAVEHQNGEVLVNGQVAAPTSSKGKSKSKSNNAVNGSNSEHNSKKTSKMPVVNGDIQNKEAETVSHKEKEKKNIESASKHDVKSEPTPSQAESSVNDAAPSRRGNGLETEGSSLGEARGSIDGEADSSLQTFKSRRSRKYDDPPIYFPDVDGEGSYNKLMDLVNDKITHEDKCALKEILEYVICPEGGAWALGSPHLDAIGQVLMDRNLPEEAHVLMLKILSTAALKEDVILLLHQDRENHHIMSYLYRIENLSQAEQDHIGLFMCNLCSNASSFDWLMYISEWQEDGHSCNNSKVTVRASVFNLLSGVPNLEDKGSALIYNLALKELFDDIASELSMALMQFLHSDLNEELAFRSLTALLRFMTISYNDVPALMKMMGPDLRRFVELSERCGQLVDQIKTKLRVSISA